MTPGMARSASEVSRDMLRVQIESRFEGEYNPSLVLIDDEWHYPLTPERTQCGRQVPDPVTTVAEADFSGPSSFGCSECGVNCGAPTKRDLQNRIRRLVGTDHNRAAQLNREDLMAILSGLESGVSKE